MADEKKLHKLVKIGDYFADVHLKHGALIFMIKDFDSEKLARHLLESKPMIEPWE